MEKHKCKLCFKVFMNGKALGGHMSRSHFTNLPLPKTPQKKEAERTESTSEFSSDGHESEEKGLSYGLRDNPKKSFRLGDGEFCDAGSFVQDKESEAESARNPTRKRSKRARRMVVENNVVSKVDQGFLKRGSTESLTELEMVSSVSDVAAAAAATATSDEDVAFCLLMLSRDVWSSHDSVELKLSQTRCQHRCELCKKVFKSSQALGGHRISHKKIVKKCVESYGLKKPRNSGNVAQKKVHECPFCGKVFGSGQALGGHKRSHLLGSSTAASCSSKVGDSLVDSNSAKSQEGFIIDLNLPAPMEDDEDQQEVSAVSNAADFIITPLKIQH